MASNPDKFESSFWVKDLMQAYIVAIAAPQTAKNNRRYDGECPETDQRIMDSMNHLGRIGVHAGNEKGCS